MKTTIQRISHPVVTALFVLAAGLFVLITTTDSFTSKMAKDRAEMETALRQTQTPEPQIAAISRVLDRVTSHVHSMAISFFSFTIVMVVCTFTFRRTDTPKQTTETQQQGEMRRIET